MFIFVIVYIELFIGEFIVLGCWVVEFMWIWWMDVIFSCNLLIIRLLVIVNIIEGYSLFRYYNIKCIVIDGLNFNILVLCDCEREILR